jgi:hypothetical protein
VQHHVPIKTRRSSRFVDVICAVFHEQGSCDQVNSSAHTLIAINHSVECRFSRFSFTLSLGLYVIGQSDWAVREIVEHGTKKTSPI